MSEDPEAVVDVHVACRQPANLIRCDDESLRVLSARGDDASVRRSLADGIVGYAVAVSDRIVSPPGNGIGSKSRVYLWDQLYVGEGGRYDGKALYSILVHHLRAVREGDGRPELEVRLHLHGEPGVAQDGLLIADVMGSPSNANINPRFCGDLRKIPMFRRVDVFSGTERVTANYTKLKTHANYVSQDQDTANPATSTVAAIDEVESNPPCMLMGNHMRTALYTGAGLDDMLDRNPVGPESVSRLVSDVVICAELNTGGEHLNDSPKIPFSDIGALYGRLVMMGFLDAPGLSKSS